MKYYNQTYYLGYLDSSSAKTKLDINLVLEVEECIEFYCPNGRDLKPEIHILGYYNKKEEEKNKENKELSDPIKDSKFLKNLQILASKVKELGEEALSDDLEEEENMLFQK